MSKVVKYLFDSRGTFLFFEKIDPKLAYLRNEKSCDRIFESWQSWISENKMCEQWAKIKGILKSLFSNLQWHSMPYNHAPQRTPDPQPQSPIRLEIDLFDIKLFEIRGSRARH